MDQEGNINSPLGCFKLAPRPVTTSAVSRSSPSTATTVTAAVTTSSASSVACLCCPLSGNISTCPAFSPAAVVTTTTTSCTTTFSRPALAVPQPKAAARATVKTATGCTTMVPTVVAITPAMIACSPAPVPAYGLPPCFIDGVRVPRSQQKVRKLVSTLETALGEKDMAATTLIKKHKADLLDMQKKYDALYFHCTAMAKDLRRKDAMLDCLKDADRAHQTLCAAQKQLARSTVALAKNHRTRFCTDRHQVTYRSTDSSPEVQHEMNLAAARIREEKVKQERADLAKLSDAVDRLARKYDRYNMISTTKIHNTRCAPDGLPCIVPRDMMGLWLFANMEEEPTAEEIAMYEFHLQKEVRGAPIYSPTLPKPTVNWANLNKHRRKNLPDPELFPVHFVPADPTFYMDRTKYKPADQHNNGEDPMKSARIISGKDCGCAKCVPPFGRRYGLMTDMGVIAMPDTSVHGYKWDDLVADWVIATGC